MGFAERNGFVKEKTVQVDEIDKSLRLQTEIGILLIQF